MFYLNFFYNTEEIHKLLIKKSFNDIKEETIIYKKKYPNYNGYYTVDEYNILNDETKKNYDKYTEKLELFSKILINNLLNYCKNYPLARINNNRFINEYEDFPYRLEQNIEEVLLEL